MSAYRSLRDRQLDVNLLMVIAAAGSVAVGRVADAAALLFLFSLSTTLESFAMARTRSAIESLIKLRPSEAWRVEGNVEERVPVESLRLGDIIRVLAYESVPTDAEIIDGVSRIDKSAMTGESRPEACRVGDPIVGGTQNLEGTILAKVTAVVGNSALDRIVSLVQEAQENKASGERISDWFGRRYTVFVLIAFAASLGVRSLLGQPFPEAFYTSLILLVGMSPCALVISTPATTLSALAWCARNGILVRGGEFIERVGHIRAVTLDKTGTLTWGRPTLCSVVHVPAGDSSELLLWNGTDPADPAVAGVIGEAAAVERFSSHPIAAAVLSANDNLGRVLSEVSAHSVVPGLGVVATTRRGRVLVGREELLTREGILIPPKLKSAVEDLEAKGRTVSLVASSFGVSAFAFSDGLRDGADVFVRRLLKLGIRRIAILTGDREETAKTVAEQVGIQEVYAGLLPGQKTEIVKRISSQDEVMMVGDGVNDAPSLASASVGVAMGGLGSDVAMNAADIVLVNDRIDLIPDLISLGRRTGSTIRTNLFFAGAVIVILTTASLMSRVPLPLAVLGHEGSTVIVILNGLRMLRGPARRN
ncbi:MAG: heavy metal translocating P-type ATPase [Fimbriimonas sp.]